MNCIKLNCISILELIQTATAGCMDLIMPLCPDTVILKGANGIRYVKKQIGFELSPCLSVTKTKMSNRDGGTSLIMTAIARQVPCRAPLGKEGSEDEEGRDGGAALKLRSNRSQRCLIWISFKEPLTTMAALKSITFLTPGPRSVHSLHM